jgi:hypothetical protein
VLTIRYSQRVEVEEVRQCLTTVRKLLGQLRPGFLLLTDLGNLKSMDPACAPELGAIMDLCSASGMATVVRVIPDPTKDIGFNVISLFHLDPKVKTRTCTSLAEAISSLLGEPLEETAMDVTSVYGATVPSS